MKNKKLFSMITSWLLVIMLLAGCAFVPQTQVPESSSPSSSSSSPVIPPSSSVIPPSSSVIPPSSSAVSTVSPACDHSWINAVCIHPKTCSKCGTTEGSPTGHSWLEGSCTEPQRCSVCGTTTGDAPHHTYNAQGQCTVCKVFDPVLVKRYNNAIAIIDRCTASPTQDAEDLAKAYKLLVEVGDFKDAKEYLKRFSRVSVLKKTNQTAVNAFGEPISPFIAENTRSTYNSRGQLLEHYNGFFTIQYAYKENGLVDKEAYKIGGTDSSTSFIVQFTYDAAGKLTHITRTTSNGKTETREVTYDDKGRVISTYEFTSSLVGFFCYVHYEYDQSDRVVKKTTEIGNRVYEYTYTGDKITECKMLNVNNNSYEIIQYFYDGENLTKTESTHYSNDGTKGIVVTTVYTYGDVYIY